MINSVIGAPPGTVLGGTELLPNPSPELLVETPHVPEGDLRALNYYADFGGCGHWRMIWPEILLNGYKKCIVHGSTQIIPYPYYYSTMESVRIQRQVTPIQLSFVQKLCEYKEIAKKDFRIIYEIDDIIFPEDIPLYNNFRKAFLDPAIKESAIGIMNLCDEITVTCDFMKEYFESKTGHKGITVLKNYLPKFWIYNFYDERRLSIEYDKNVKKRKRPRVLYAGAGAHFNVSGESGIKDDFSHIIDNIIKTRKKFQWVFLGGYPLVLKPYIQSGEMEYIKFANIYNYPQSRYNIHANVSIAPLADNTFNKAKSDLKLIESGAYGIPAICQDICTYENAIHKFQTGDEMIDQIDSVLSDKQTYLKSSRKHRALADGRWLEDHIDEYRDLYLYSRGSPLRKALVAT